MKKIIVLFLSSIIFASCSSTPQVVEPVSEEKKAELYKVGAIDKLRPKVTSEGLKAQDQVWVAYVKEVTDKLEIKRYDEAGAFVTMSFVAQNGHLLKVGDMLDTSVKTRAEIVFRDGTKLRLGPLSVLRIDSYDPAVDKVYIKMNLLTGSARLDVRGGKDDPKVEIYSPNVVVNSKKADFAVKYNNSFKTTSIACFSGEIFAYTLNDNRIIKGYENVLTTNESMLVETTYEGPKEVYIARDPQKLNRATKKDVLGSFYTDPEEIDPWEYTGISTNFLRFLTGFEYSGFTEVPDKYYSWTLGYVPIIHLASVIYLEPYFELAFAKPFSMTFFRTGARLEFQVYDGFYAGFGGGIFWVSDKIKLASTDLGFNVGYSFVNKPLDFIDGLRFSYAAAKTNDGYHQKCFMFSVLMSFYNGRELF